MPMSQVSSNEAVRSVVQQFIDQANSTVSRAESVRKFVILEDEFTQDAGTLTPSMKVVRPKVLKRYANIIDSQLYAPKPNTKPFPATVKILDRTTETMRQAQEAVTPRVRQAIDQAASQIMHFGDESSLEKHDVTRANLQDESNSNSSAEE